MTMKKEETAGRNITPATRVGKLLEDFPQLEDTLIRMSPSFKKLRNQVLRKTVGKVATLRQVAKVGDIPLADLVNALRREAGLPEVDMINGDAAGSISDNPEWSDAARIVKRFDARSMIEAGQQPMGTVLKQLNELKEGEIYELTTPFVPAPLIDMVKDKGYAVWTKKGEEECVLTYISRK
jgi:hypothetical protein